MNNNGKPLTIDILLATYNGEKYLRQQLESILNQDNKNWRLVVRDDGSTDNTKEILQEYAQRVGREKFVLLNAVEENRSDAHSYISNFSKLTQWSLKDGKAEYMMFCDQDDKWHADKVDKTLAEMKTLEKQHGSQTPLLVHTDVALMHASGSLRYPSIKHRCRLFPAKTTFKQELLVPSIQGCTLVMNRKLAEQALPFPERIAHDAWVGMVARATGHVGYLAESTMDYRLHNGNVTTGARRVGIRKRIERYADGLDHSVEMAQELKDRLGDCIPSQNRDVIDRFLEIAHYRQPFRALALLEEGYTRTGPLERNLMLFGGHRSNGNGRNGHH